MRLPILFVLCLFATAVFAQENSKRKEGVKSKQLDNRILNAKEGGIDEDEEEYEEQRDEKPDMEFRNPCNIQKCKRGETCDLQDGKAVCMCQSCEEEDKSVIKVCSTKNVTYESECELDRDHCLCRNGLQGCSDPNENKIKLEYYAACKELTKCSGDEFNMFPSRMRDWFFRVMKDLASREELGDYLDKLESASKDEYHADAVVWKFCDLDAKPEDSRVTRKELAYIVASIKPMEHCLVPFLKGCDANNDNAIVRAEWLECLGIEHDHLKDKCRPIHNKRG